MAVWWAGCGSKHRTLETDLELKHSFSAGYSQSTQKHGETFQEQIIRTTLDTLENAEQGNTLTKTTRS